MNILKFANNAQTTLAAPLAIGATSVTLTPGAGVLFPTLTTGFTFLATLTDAATGLINEIVLATARSGDTVTIVRAQDGTSDLAWLTGDIFWMLDTAGTMAQMVQAAQLQSGTYSLAVAGGTANALTATIQSPLTLTPDGMTVIIHSSAANTGAATLTLTLGSTLQTSASIVKGNNVPLAANDIPGADYDIVLIYNDSSGNFVMQNIPPVTGVVYASSATTQTGTSTTQAVTPKGLADTMLCGVGQAYVDVTASRAIGTVYTNSTARPILVIACVIVGPGGQTNLLIGGVSVQEFGNALTNNFAAPLSFIVPPGATYELSNIAGINAVVSWAELR